MKLSVNKFNTFLMFKLPSAFFCGVRIKQIEREKCMTSVRLNWMNKNPFKSLFWAVQGMAAELSSGALVLLKIRESGYHISMLVANNNASFFKKAKGRIYFECTDGLSIEEALDKAIKTGEGQTIWVNAKGKNREGVLVSEFNFEWTLKLKSEA